MQLIGINVYSYSIVIYMHDLASIYMRRIKMVGGKGSGKLVLLSYYPMQCYNVIEFVTFVLVLANF